MCDTLNMRFDNEKRANEVAAILNAIPGFPPAYAILTADGWTVVRMWSR